MADGRNESKRESMETRARRRSDYYASAKKRKLSGFDKSGDSENPGAKDAVHDFADKVVMRASGAAAYAGKTKVGKQVVKAANTRAGKAVGGVVTGAANSVAGAAKSAAGATVRAASAVPGAVEAGVGAVKHAAETVKTTASAVDKKVPFYQSRSLNREIKRGDKAAAKELKAEKAVKRQTREFDRMYHREGSDEYQAYIDELCMNILGEQKSFVDYVTDMQAWMDEREARKDFEERNEKYCRNMFDYCISPLQHGVSAESVADTLGLYIGMSLLSKEFRETVGSEIQRLVQPVRERVGSMNADFKDREAARNARKAEAIVRHCGYDPSSLQDIPDMRTQRPKLQWAAEYLSEYEEGANTAKHEARMKMKRDEIAMAKNHGRIPLNPETAALQKLNLMHTYYTKLRDPSISKEDASKLEGEYKTAEGVLQKLMEHDKVDEADMNVSFRTIVGQLTAVHPEYECEFGSLVYGDIVKSDGKAVDAPDVVRNNLSKDSGQVYAWRGEYHYAGSGQDYTRAFDVRLVQDRDAHKKEAVAALDKVYKNVDTADDMAALLTSDWMVKMQKRFETIMGSDYRVLDAREPGDRPRDAIADTQACFDEAMNRWLYGHDPTFQMSDLSKKDDAGNFENKNIESVIYRERGKPPLVIFKNNHVGESQRLSELLEPLCDKFAAQSGRNVGDMGDFTHTEGESQYEQ